mgnify:CR=1 FL=1|jgi:hypothetical protein
MSNTFIAIRRLVQRGLLDNTTGFRASEIIRLNNNLNPDTVRTFLPKHTRNRVIYFERLQRGLYRILNTHLLNLN